LKFIARPFVALDRFFAGRSQNVVVLICLIASLLIGGLDYWGSPGVLILYLVPVAVSAWYGGAKSGYVISVYCALAWLFQSMHGHFDHASPVAQLIDLGARLITFCFLVSIIARLRTAQRVQKELIAFIIHDLRSPISSAITGIYTLQQSESQLDPLDREMIDLALVSNERALNLVNSILDVAKFESGTMSIKVEKIHLKEFGQSCIDEVALWARGFDLTIDLRTDAEEGLFDRELTGRVVVNLLSNAIKFSPPKARISVAISRISVGGLHFVISDDGPGIPADYLSSIFEPFGQVEGTKGGTGLGLTFCRLAVQAQHGKIWAESKLGHGAQMHFTLPSSFR
jgi:NtrC-family two-component system sensor histidine kinase KinB